jgi:hypothetical protein
MKMVKRSLIVMLSLMMVSIVVGCPDDGGGKKEEEKPGNSYNGKTVDQKFWGDWKYNNYSVDDYLITITETEWIEKYYTSLTKSPAWSEGDILYNRFEGVTNFGTLIDDSTIQFEDKPHWFSFTLIRIEP